jgi:hypothetical protein
MTRPDDYGIDPGPHVVGHRDYRVGRLIFIKMTGGAPSVKSGLASQLN